MPDQTIKRISNKISIEIPIEIPNEIPIKIPAKISEKIPIEMLAEIPTNISAKIPKKILPKELPLVTVIIPTFNRERFLERSIGSVLKQTYGNLEILVVNDRSTDATSKLLKTFSDSRITLLHTDDIDIQLLPDIGNVSSSSNVAEPHTRGLPLGVSIARNLGIRHAKGDYIAFLDSDDEWSSDKLDIQIASLLSSDKYWIHCNELWMHHGKKVTQLKKHKKAGGEQFERALEICCIGASCVLIDQKILKEIGLFKTDFMVCEDYDLWLRILAIHPIAFIEEELVVKYAGHEGQLSFQNIAMDEYRVRAITELLESVDLTPKKRQLAEEQLLKKCKILEKGFRKRSKYEKADFYQSIINSYLRK